MSIQTMKLSGTGVELSPFATGLDPVVSRSEMQTRRCGGPTVGSRPEQGVACTDRVLN